MIFPFDAAVREIVSAIAEKYRIYGTLRPDNLRVCLNIYNTEEQMKDLAAAAGEIAAL